MELDDAFSHFRLVLPGQSRATRTSVSKGGLSFLNFIFEKKQNIRESEPVKTNFYLANYIKNTDYVITQ